MRRLEYDSREDDDKPREIHSMGKKSVISRGRTIESSFCRIVVTFVINFCYIFSTIAFIIFSQF